MCYDIAFYSALELIDGYFPNIVRDGDIEFNFEAGVHIMGHAYGEHPIIYTNREDGLPHLRMMEWGCVPFYVKDLKQFARQRPTMLNARSERILGDEKSYWFKIRNRRCLIPVSGFYEHRAIKGWKKKVPYFIKLKNDEILFIPGLYSVVELPDLETGELLKRLTFTLITRDANEVMKQIHNDGENKWRMPLLLPFELSQAFIADDLTTEKYIEILGFEMPSSELDYWPVFTIRSPKGRPDNKIKNEYWKWEDLPELESGNPNL
ncbi:MAG TPA: SOS response-associated peptidase family protein [Chitinophagaceae bacterium]|nr:SOS response-associated peptidase family protein [Chitinophagaceae bacterium]